MVGSSSKPVLGFWFVRMLHFGVSLRVDEVVEIFAGGRTAWQGSITASQKIWIAAKNLWGGEKGEGGVEGDVYVMMGEPDQPVNEYLRSRQGNRQSAFRNYLTLLFAGTKFGALVPYLKPVGVRVRKHLRGWNGDAWYPEKAVILQQGGAVKAMNPAHIFYRSIVNLGTSQAPRGLIDDVMFRAAADYFNANGVGLCVKHYGDETVAQLRERIARVSGCNFWQDRRDGLYKIQPVTAPYDIESLPIVTMDDIESIERPTINTGELINRLQVKWYDPVKRTDRMTPPRTLLAGVRSAGRVISDVADYPEIADPDLASRIRDRDLDARGKPMQQFDLVLKSRRADLDFGGLFRLQIPEEGIADMVCRIVDLDVGTLRNSLMTLSALQERASLKSASFVQPIPDPPTQDVTPRPAEFRQLAEVPYAVLAANMTPADLAAVPAESGYLGVLAARPPVVSINYTLATAVGSEPYEERGTGYWADTAQIVEAAAPAQQDFTMAAVQGMANVAVGDALLWGSEITRVLAKNDVAGTIKLARGCMDTVPALHAAGERIWSLGDLSSDERECALGETARAKVLTRTPGAQLDLNDAPADSLVMAQRAARPYPPGRLRIDDAVYPVETWGTAGTLTATWAHRDRLLQADQVIDTEANNIGPEPGTSYVARWYVDNVLSRTSPATSGTTDSFTPPAGSGGKTVRVEIESIRDGLTSWQRLSHTFVYRAQLVTEAGDRIVTEEGDPIILE